MQHLVILLVFSLLAYHEKDGLGLNLFGAQSLNYRICASDLFGPSHTFLWYKGAPLHCKNCKKLATNVEKTEGHSIKVDKTWVLMLTCLYSKHISLEPLMGSHDTKKL